MAVNGCGQICKWLIILFNVLFILVGLALSGAGTYLRISAVGTDLKTNHFIFMVSLCIAIGVVIIITAMIGDYGAYKEKKSALSVYISLLFLLAVAVAVGGGVAFVYNREFYLHVAEFYSTIYIQYMITGDVIRAFILKLVHTAFDCCGVGGVMQTIMGATHICPYETSIMGIPVSTSSSCLTVIENQLKASSVLIFFVVIVVILIMVLVCVGFIHQQLSRPALMSPPYIPLSSNPCSPSFMTICSTVPSSSPPSYTTVSDHV